jgi:endonuclease-3
MKAKRAPAEAERAAKIFRSLSREYPEAGCTLDHHSPLELLVSTILSAQCTDARVNQVTPKLFAKYRTAKDFAKRPIEELEREIKPTGFYRQKAKSIRAACRILVEKHQGEVPAAMDALLELPGVARKTANVVLGNGFGIASGIVVDTHVRRLAGRLDLSREKDPVKIEQDLIKLFPKKHWILVGHLLQAHGRRICLARKPLHEKCVVRALCPSADI